jgi:hypothetical protein
MRVDSNAIRVRPRANFEAADLGVRLCQSAAHDVFPCYLSVLAPLACLTIATYRIADWLPMLLLWWAKPWLDRTILFVLSRAALGQPTRPADVWREQHQVLWNHLLPTLTLRRLSPWRSFTQPVYQLEGLRGAELRTRVRQIRAGRTRAGTAILSAFGCAETSVFAALTSLLVLFATQRSGMGLTALLLSADGAGWLDFALCVAYAITIAFVEPFYVAAGFGLYLTRRAELEGWDMDPQLRPAPAAASRGAGLI